MNKFAIFLLLNIFLLSSCKKEHIEFVERNNELKSGMMTMGSIPLTNFA